MSYEYPPPEYFPTDEEKRLEVLGPLSQGCLLTDVIDRKSRDQRSVHERDYAGLSRQSEHPFDYPDARILNEMINEDILSVHISPYPENQYVNQRNFTLTEKGHDYVAMHTLPVDRFETPSANLG